MQSLLVRRSLVQIAARRHVMPSAGAALSHIMCQGRFQSASTQDHKKKSPPTKPKRKGQPTGGSASGRIAAVAMDRRKKKSAVAKLCSGCGVEIISGGRGGGRQQQSSKKLVAGEDAVNENLSRKQAKKAQYADVMETFRSGKKVLCERCKSLQAGNVWQAYDALRDVDASVFSNQLKHIVGRRRFGLCVLVVDATDPEFTAVKRLRDIVRSTPCILAVNKTDLLPRMNEYDLRFIRSRVESRGVRMIDAYAVSAQTGQGLAELAEGLLSRLGGRDVFVVGSANVGKSSLTKSLSSLLAKTLWLRGKARQASRRKDTLTNLPVTASHLPGTTLQAVRIPCFPSNRHALWDTPGIINKSALDYSLFPSHLLEPLAYPAPILIPSEEDGTKRRVKPGESILIQAAWINERLKNDDVPAFTLARLDIVESTRPVEALAFLPTSLNIRVVPTEEAPASADIPDEYARAVEERTGEKGNYDKHDLTRPLDIYTGGDGSMKEGVLEFDAVEESTRNGWIRKDIVFASLGWIMLNHRGSFRVRPMCVQGSLWARRRALYPSNMSSEEVTEDYVDSEDFKDKQVRLKVAAEQGKHQRKPRKHYR